MNLIKAKIFIVIVITMPWACSPKASYNEKEFYKATEYVAFIDEQFESIDARVEILNQSFSTKIMLDQMKDNTSFIQGTPTYSESRPNMSQEGHIKFNYAKLLQTTDSAMLVLNTISGFGDNESVKQSSQTLCIFYNNLFHQEYRKLLEFYLSDRTPTRIQLDSINTLVNQIHATEDSLKLIYKETVNELIKEE